MLSFPIRGNKNDEQLLSLEMELITEIGSWNYLAKKIKLKTLNVIIIVLFPLLKFISTYLEIALLS
jgi:hypothetical protein